MAPSNFLLPIALKKVVRGYPSKAAPLGSALFAKNLGSFMVLKLKEISKLMKLRYWRGFCY